jgi:hypothetical protein
MITAVDYGGCRFELRDVEYAPGKTKKLRVPVEGTRQEFMLLVQEKMTAFLNHQVCTSV